MNVTIWHEDLPQEEHEQMKKVYPNGLSDAIYQFLKASGVSAKKVFLAEKENGLPQEVLDNTDVLVWWGHCKHHLVDDETAKRVVKAVQCGMGAVFLHSSHLAKPFTSLLGTSGTLKWRENPKEHELLWVTSPAHPIAQGVDECIRLDNEEMYGEYFDIPKPDDVVFIGWFKGGNVFRSGVTFTRGLGKIFYFQPGHETYPVYHNKSIQKIITNAVNWAKPALRVAKLECPHDGNSKEIL